jgi:hypothetical protein
MDRAGLHDAARGAAGRFVPTADQRVESHAPGYEEVFGEASFEGASGEAPVGLVFSGLFVCGPFVSVPFVSVLFFSALFLSVPSEDEGFR